MCQTIERKVNKTKRTLLRQMALVLCVLFILISAFSFAFIATHESHTHDHNGPDGACTTCVFLQFVGDFLKQITVVATAAVTVLARLFTAFYFLKLVCNFCAFNIPVSLKVRLNN